MTQQDRKLILLKAAYELLSQQRDSHYVIDILSATAVWDGAVCDGYCLMEEIKDELENYDVSVNTTQQTKNEVRLKLEAENAI